MADERDLYWKSTKVDLKGNTAGVRDVKEAGLWNTVKEAPLTKGADGKIYSDLPDGYSYVGYGGMAENMGERADTSRKGWSAGNADAQWLGSDSWDAVQKAKDDWTKAWKAGDQAGMDAAHAAAESVRANYGYSGGADGSGYNPLMFQSGSRNTYGQRTGEKTAADLELEQLRAQIERQVEAQKAANRSAYREYRLGQRDLNEQMVAAGLSGTGTPQEQQAALTARYLATQAGNEADAIQTREDGAIQEAGLRLQAQAEARQRQLQQEAQARQEAQQRAQILAQYGDFSGYGSLGYTPQQIAAMENGYRSRQGGYDGLGSYAQTLLQLYQSNPGFDLRSGLETALNRGLISEQDYRAGLLAAGL